MPDFERRRPRAATCEDWDEDAQTTLPGSQTTANVSAKRSQQDLVLRQREKVDYYGDGGDSGYASRAPTTISESTASSRRKMPDLKIDTVGIRERERKPYLVSQSAAPKVSSRRHSVTQSKEPSPEKRSTKHKHAHGERGHVDSHAKHTDNNYPPNSTHPPPSVTARATLPKASKDDQALPVRSRRQSASQQPRPVSMLPPSSAIPMQYAVHPAYGPPTSGYATPVTPSIPYGPIPFAYAPPPAPVPTPSYQMYQPMPNYFDQLPEPRSARQSRHPSPVRRTSTYGEPVIKHGYSETSSGSLERIPSKESRPAPSSKKSFRSIEVEREKGSMGPPPRPNQPDMVLARRPSTRRTQSYHPQPPTVHERAIYDEDRDRFDSDDENDYRPVRAAPPTAVRDRRESATRPPSSYRPPVHAEVRERPLPRKSVSYSAGTTVTKVATSAPHGVSRRMTVPLEQKEAEAEEYQARQNQVAVASGLTVEALRKFDQRTSSSKSETGSNFSHQSSSKDSSGRGRSQTGGTKTSITLPGGVNMTIPPDYMKQDGRPLSINFGGFVLSLGAEGKENERPREQKRIERAPSVASRASKRSAASSIISNRDKDRGRDMPPPASRRPSQLEERGPSVRSSRQPSRAPSTNRRSHDYSSRPQSADYSREYDDIYAQG